MSLGSMYSEVYRLLRRLGITPNYTGYFQTAQAVELCLEEPERLTLITKLVYSEVAGRYGVNWTTVERNIRTVAMLAWESNPEAMEELMGRKLNSRPVASQFIAALTFKVMPETLPGAPERRRGPEWDGGDGGEDEFDPGPPPGGFEGGFHAQDGRA